MSAVVSSGQRSVDDFSFFLSMLQSVYKTYIYSSLIHKISLLLESELYHES